MPSRQGLLWIGWVIKLIICGLFGLLCFITFSSLTKIKVSADGLTGAKTVCIVAAVLLFSNLLVSLVILAKKSLTHSGAGFSYGWVVSSNFHMAFFCLAVSVSLGARRKEASRYWERDQSWGSGDTALLTTTFALGYVAAFVFFVMFFMGLCNKSALKKEEVKVPAPPVVAAPVEPVAQDGVKVDMENPY